MFWRSREKSNEFLHEVLVEVEYLRRLHGLDAARVAAEKAARPNLRTLRRKVLTAAAERLRHG